MRTITKIIISLAIAAAIFLLIGFSRQLNLSFPTIASSSVASGISQLIKGKTNPPAAASSDIGKQSPLAEPPAITNGVYATGWSAGSLRSVNYLTDFIKGAGFNSIIIDIKDYSGYLSYKINVPEFNSDGANSQIKISKINSLIKTLHDNNIYVIGRITVFQDPILAKAHPEWALQDKTTRGTWLDNHKLAWMDPASKEVWAYDADIAKDALSRGFDEINFDYVRFASDGDLNNIGYPFWDEKISKAAVIKSFFAYLRNEMPNARLSVDIFGLATINHDDLGIGQVIEDAFPYFNYIDPMVYPSHYASGFLGYKNPALYPYEVIKYSMDSALARLRKFEEGPVAAASTSSAQAAPAVLASRTAVKAEIRPWLQDFNLGATYDASMVAKEYNAVEDSFSTSSAYFGGVMLWNPSNIYTAGVFSPISTQN